jgi:hypothetical protein
VGEDEQGEGDADEGVMMPVKGIGSECQRFSDMGRMLLCSSVLMGMSHCISMLSETAQLQSSGSNRFPWPKNRGFKKAELKKITNLVEQNQQLLIEAWHDYFGA